MENKETIEKINELLFQANSIRNHQVSKLVEITREAFALSTKIGFKTGQLRSLLFLGFYHSLKRNTKECIQVCSQMVTLIDGDKEYELYFAHSKKLLGIEKVYLGDHEASFKLLYEALEIYKRLEYHEEVFTVEYLLANTWRTIGNYFKAFEFLQSALTNCRSLNNKVAEVEILIHIIEIHIINKSYESAKKNLFDAIKILKELNLAEKTASCLIRLGEIYLEYKDYNLALDYLNQSLEILLTIPKEDYTGSGFIVDVYLYLGKIHVIYQDNAKAEMYYHLASEYVTYFNISVNHAFLNLCYSELRFNQNNKFEARKYADEAMQYYDSIDSVQSKRDFLEKACETFKLLEDYKTCYELAKKMMEIDAKKYEGFLEQRVKENDLKFKFADIEKQIIIERENTQKANMLNESLTEQNNEKNEFMGIVAHDLKNPISNITMLSKLLVSQAPTIKEEEIKDIAGDLMETSERMFDLVDKLLDFNAIETGNLTLEIQSIDLNTILQKVMKHNKVSAKSKDIELLFSSTVNKHISSDESRLFQVFDNLLSNAIKYTKPSSTVSIRVEQLHLSAENQPTSNTMLKVEIQDQGEGIPKDEIPNLFKKFARLSTKPTAGEHSTGLGLSIVKRIVEQLQGSVYCESTVGKGSTFFVELPLEIS